MLIDVGIIGSNIVVRPNNNNNNNNNRHTKLKARDDCTVKKLAATVSRTRAFVTSSVTRKKLPNVYRSCLKMISVEK